MVTSVNTCTPNLEAVWIKLVLPQTKPVYYRLIYRPPDGNVIYFVSEQDVIIIDLRSRSDGKVNILGDFNLYIHKCIVDFVYSYV